MRINYDNNNGKTIIHVNSEWEKSKIVDALYDMDISSYFIDDTTYRDQVIVSESFTQDDLNDLATYLTPSYDFDSVPSFSNMFGYISGVEDFDFNTASYGGMSLAQFT